MKFDMLRDKIQSFIDEYMDEIFKNGKLTNFDTLKKRIDSLSSCWDNNSDLIRRQLIETLNEVCFVHYLVSKENCEIEYEPIIKDSKKSIDILAKFEDKNIYFDIKTIHPTAIDKWSEYVKAKENGIIDGGIDLYQDGMGGEIWHKMIASRSKFAQYSLQFETKIKEIDDGTSYYFLVLCGNDIDWHVDELEDFVEYYITDRFIVWDHFKSMTQHYFKEKGISFERTINNFTVLIRDKLSKDYKVIPFVRADKKFRQYV